MSVYMLATITVVIVGIGAFFSAVLGYLASSSWRRHVDQLADRS